MTEITQIKIDKEFKICPECGYTNGFHVIFERIEASDGKNFSVKLICPSCGKIYDIGLKAHID
jgi:hypothetical protein